MIPQQVDKKTGESIIFCVNFKKALRMIADRALIGSVGAHHKMTAVAAFPNLNLALGEDRSCFHVFQKCSVTLFVVFFDGCHHTELGGQFGETFFFGLELR